VIQRQDLRLGEGDPHGRRASPPDCSLRRTDAGTADRQYRRMYCSQGVTSSTGRPRRAPPPRPGSWARSSAWPR
jgi:hypothetical protein